MRSGIYYEDKRESRDIIVSATYFNLEVKNSKEIIFADKFLYSDILRKKPIVTSEIKF